MRRIVCYVFMIAFCAVGQEVHPKFNDNVAEFLKNKVEEVEQELKAYHQVKDLLSEKPIGDYESYFDESKFNSFPAGIKEKIQERKICLIFQRPNFPDVAIVNSKLDAYLTLKNKTERQTAEAKDVLRRKCTLGKLSWAKCESDSKKLDEKAYYKLRDAYWKMMKEFFKKYLVAKKS